MVHLAAIIMYLNKHDMMYLQSELMKNGFTILQGHKMAVGYV